MSGKYRVGRDDQDFLTTWLARVWLLVVSLTPFSTLAVSSRGKLGGLFSPALFLPRRRTTLFTVAWGMVWSSRRAVRTCRVVYRDYDFVQLINSI